MKITVITVGKIKEEYFKDAIAEYTKRINNYTTLKKIEIADEKIIESKTENIIKDKEGEKILKVLPDNSYKVALSETGKQFSSVKFAGFIKNLKEKGVAEITFIIGGALGLSDSVIIEADYKLALSE